MTDEAEVALALLDTHFLISSDDPRMAGFVRQLWAPFVVPSAPPGAVPVGIETRGERWRMELPDDAGAAAKDPWVFGQVLRNALSRRAIAEASAIVPLHAAAVERDGVCVVLSGPPRAGKTTLLLELLDRGWRLVTDDLVPVSRADLTAMPFPKPLNVREPERWRRFSGRWEVPAWLPPPTAGGLIPPTAFPLVDAEPFRPSILVFPAFLAGAEPVAEALTAAQTVAACARNLHPAGLPDPSTLAVLARLGAATPGHSLRYGSTGAALELFQNCLAGSPSME